MGRGGVGRGSLDEVYKEVLAEYPELLELQEINIDLLNKIQQVQVGFLEIG